MPRKFFKRWMPDIKALKAHGSLRWLGNSLDAPNIWHLNRQSVARAFLIGLFFALLPIPLQMLLAACCAIGIHANLPIAVSLVWITNPLTFAPIFYFNYKIGCSLLNIETTKLLIDPSSEHVFQQLSAIWQPLLLGSLVMALIAGIIGYVLVWRIWAWQVVTRWEERKKLRLEKNKPTN